MNDLISKAVIVASVIIYWYLKRLQYYVMLRVLQTPLALISYFDRPHCLAINAL